MIQRGERSTHSTFVRTIPIPSPKKALIAIDNEGVSAVVVVNVYAVGAHVHRNVSHIRSHGDISQLIGGSVALWGESEAQAGSVSAVKICTSKRQIIWQHDVNRLPR